MTALLRADWIRYRRRLDLWIITLAVVVFSGIAFLSGYRNAVTDPPQMSPAEIHQMVVEQSFFEGIPQEEIDTQIEQMVRDFSAQQEQERLGWEAQQAITLQQFDVWQAPLTILGLGIGPLIALFLATTLIVGDEFRHGTVRTSLLAASDRRRFLAARFVTIVALTVGLFALVLALGVILSLGLHLVAAELPRPTIAIDGPSAVGLVGAEILSVLTIVALGVALTVLLRSGALPLLLALLAAGIELFVGNLPIFWRGELLEGVQQVLPFHAIQALVATLADKTNAIAFAEQGGDPDPRALGMWVVTLIVVAWFGLFVAIAERRFRTMDIVE